MGGLVGATACAAPHCIRTVVAGMWGVGILADGMLEAGTLTRPLSKIRQMMSRQMSLRHPAPSRTRTQSQPRRVGTMTPACTRPSSSGAHLSVGHHVGYFCNRYTRVRCCRTGWGYSMCGTTLHSNRCGWHVGGWHAGGWHAGGWHLDQATNQTDDEPADVVEAPSAEQEANPEPAREGWDNDTSLHSALQHWGASFCRVPHVGYFCNRYTRVRCCRTGWGYSMCGTTLHSNRCGWR